MDSKRGAKGDASRGNELSVSYLRLMAPPLQLFSAAMWQVVQQGLVDHYGMLEEFVTMVTELVPQLMSYSQKAQLILGLRARLVLELCRGDQPADLQTIQPHLDRIKAPVSSAKDPHTTIDHVEESEVNFVELVHTLLEDPSERANFFQEIFPEHFGSKYDTALEMLVWEFISRLDQLLPVPDFSEMVTWMADVPSFMNDCLQSFQPPEGMKAVLQHHSNLGHFEEKDPGLLPMDDCILSSLSVTPMSRLDESRLLKVEEHQDAPSELTDQKSDRRGHPERTRHKHLERKDSGPGQPNVRGRNGSFSHERREQILNNTFQLAASSPADHPAAADPAAGGNVPSPSGGRPTLRKRKVNGGFETPSKRPSERTLSLDSPGEVESSADSPLISICGDYTDSLEASYTWMADNRVPWSDNETLNLLDIWGQDAVQFELKGCLKNRHIFTLISEKMAERGFIRSTEQCQNRIKQIKKGFRRRLRNTGNPSEYKFYDQLERVLCVSAPSAVAEGDEEPDEDQTPDDTEDLQFVSCTSREDVGSRYISWTDSETSTLISIWAEDMRQQELKGSNRSGPVYTGIAKKMAAKGFSRTAEQCQTRLKRLKSSFRHCYENNLKGKKRVECKFYDQLETILISDVQIPESRDDFDEESQPEEPMDDDLSVYPSLEIDAGGVQEERKKVLWSDKETLILLETWGDMQLQQNVRRHPHGGGIFSRISESLRANGFSRSAEQCHSRVKRLKAIYRQCQESVNSSGTDRVDFKFYDILEHILDGQQPSTSSAMLTDSIEIPEDSNSDEEEEEDEEEETSALSEKTPPNVWSDEETLALIGTWGEAEVQKSLRGFVHNGHVYADIAEKLRELGVAKTPEQCRWKVKALRNHFRHCCERKKSGRSKVEYKFYSQLEEILGQEGDATDEFEKDEEEPDIGLDGAKCAAWSEEETVALIELWASDDIQNSLKTCVHNGHIFAELSDKMAFYGYIRTAEQCQTRIKGLRKTYRRFCKSRKSGGHPMLFKYYQLLEPVLGEDAPFLGGDAAGDVSTAEELPDMEEPSDLWASTSHFQVESSRKMPWSDQETQTLLTIWGEDGVQQTLRGTVKNRHVYEYVSEKMREEGFVRTTEQCYTRMKRLKSNFHHDKKEFKFFEEMEEIFNRELKVDEAESGSVASEELPEFLADMEPDADVTPANQRGANGSKVIWTDSETEVLLEIWGSDDIQENLRSCTKNRPIFALISQAMATQGYLRTAEQCQNRIKRLKANFRQFIEGRKDGSEKQEFKFFDQLLRVFSSQYVNADTLAEESVAVSPETPDCPSP